jgi:hypothetical protein
MDEVHHVSNMEANLQCNGVDVAYPLMMGAATMLMFAYNSVPDPLLSLDAALASTIAVRALADDIDCISLLHDKLLMNVVSRLPAKE